MPAPPLVPAGPVPVLVPPAPADGVGAGLDDVAGPVPVLPLV